MNSSTINEFISEMNLMASEGKPFLFIIDYEVNTGIILPLEDCAENGIFYDIEGNSNFSYSDKKSKITINPHPIPFSEYHKSFKYIQDQLHAGNSYLINLTLSTPVTINADFLEIFQSSVAPYKLLYKDQFLVFSPECFVKINDGRIMTFPMKGTIDANLQDAEKLLLEDTKETAEHATIVDLLRNDLSRVAQNVAVEKYRYFDRINTSGKCLLQMSSLISGDLPPDYQSKLAEILIKILPAGSICGAPKKATLQIISKAETHKRGFYTGVFGIYDGKCLNSAVMIRFLENQEGKIVYKSGGGITSQSDAKQEYQELIDKIYVPID